jgi:hypothetical protein
MPTQLHAIKAIPYTADSTELANITPSLFMAIAQSRKS